MSNALQLDRERLVQRIAALESVITELQKCSSYSLMKQNEKLKEKLKELEHVCNITHGEAGMSRLETIGAKCLEVLDDAQS